jgi:hypothetical protein
MCRSDASQGAAGHLHHSHAKVLGPVGALERAADRWFALRLSVPVTTFGRAMHRRDTAQLQGSMCVAHELTDTKIESSSRVAGAAMRSTPPPLSASAAATAS